MSDRRGLVEGRREQIPLTRDEVFCQQAQQQLKSTISELADRLVEADDPDRISWLQFEISEYEKRRAIVEEVLSAIHGYLDYADDQYFQYVANINPNASTIERVAQYLAIDVQELARNSQKFLEVLRHTRLMKLAQQTEDKVARNKEISAELSLLEAKVQELQLASEQQNERLSHYEKHIGILSAALAESRQQMEDERSRSEHMRVKLEKSRQQLREERSRNEDMRVSHERELADRDERISRNGSEAQRQNVLLTRATEIWRKQKRAIQQNKRVVVDETYGLLLAKAVQRMERDFSDPDSEILDRSEHSLRQCLQDLILEGGRDYASTQCQQISRECNLYLLGKHVLQDDIDSVFSDTEFYIQNKKRSLEEKIIAFDPQSEEWWWLRYVYRRLKTAPSDEALRSIRRQAARTGDHSFLEHMDYSIFYEHFQFDEALEKEVRATLVKYIDKERMKR